MDKMKPILMSTPMVQAILDGTKTQTRRLRGLERVNESPDSWEFLSTDINSKEETIKRFKHLHTGVILEIKIPFGYISDLLWVRETIKILGYNKDGQVIIKYKDGEMESFDPSADREDYWNNKVVQLMQKMSDKDALYHDIENKRYTWKEKNVPWTPAIHMPKEAARIWLYIEDVRVERLRNIDWRDAIMEGISSEIFTLEGRIYYDYIEKRCKSLLGPYASFCTLWVSINGQKSWDHNPWVWVVQFAKIEKPTDLL